jgi:hypothetical protein
VATALCRLRIAAPGGSVYRWEPVEALAAAMVSVVTAAISSASAGFPARRTLAGYSAAR